MGKIIEDKVILGIDPGTNIMGYGLIHVKGKNIQLLEMGNIRLSKFPSHEVKLKKIFECVLTIIEKFHPDELSIEAQFFGKNVQSMLKLGRAQGVAIAAALHRDIPFTEYSPKKIKQSITGNGNASKEQVAGMLVSLKLIHEIPKDLDATDGLAAAVCHYFQNGTKGESGKKYSSWGAYVKANPKKTS